MICIPLVSDKGDIIDALLKAIRENVALFICCSSFLQYKKESLPPDLGQAGKHKTRQQQSILKNTTTTCEMQAMKKYSFPMINLVVAFILCAGSAAAEGMSIDAAPAMTEGIAGAMRKHPARMDIVQAVSKEMTAQEPLLSYFQPAIQPVVMEEIRASIKKAVAAWKTKDPLSTCMRCRGVVDPAALFMQRHGRQSSLKR